MFPAQNLAVAGFFRQTLLCYGQTLRTLALATLASLLRRTCTQLAPASGGHRPGVYAGGNRARAGRSAWRRDGGR